jgi:hypothetical protein
MRHHPLPLRALAALLAITFATPATACRLQAAFMAPAASQLPGSQPLSFALRFRNAAASGPCAANAVSLLRQGEPPVSSAQYIGAVGPPQPLPALAPGQEVTVKLVEASPPASGSHVYRIAYQRPVPVDRDTSPTRTLGFALTATLGN